MDIKDLAETPPWEWPRSAKNVIVEVLGDKQKDPSDRMTAADLAGDTVVVDDDIAELLLSVVQDPNESDELRAKAVISFGPALELADTEGYDDPYGEPPISEEVFHKVQDTLRRLYEDEKTPKEVRRRVLEAAVRAQQDWQRNAIRTAFASKDDDWKVTAVFGMAHMRGFEKEILQALNSRNSQIEREAVDAAGNWRIAEGWPHISRLLNSGTTEKSLLISAILAAGQVNPKESHHMLVDFADSEDEEVAEAADEALMMAEEPDIGEDEEEDEEDEDL